MRRSLRAYDERPVTAALRRVPPPRRRPIAGVTPLTLFCFCASFICASFICASLSRSAWAQETAPDSPQAHDDSTISARGSIGFTADPDTFLMTLEVPWKADDLVSVGPLFQLGFSDDHVLVAPTLEVYLTPRLTDDLRDIHPYAHMGMGFMYLEKDHRRAGRDEKDADFLLATGLGVEYAVQQNLFVGTGFLFDFVPAGVAGERFIFGWQMLTLRAAF